MTISAISSGLSGMKAYQQALDSASHNVANANTANFDPEIANFQENSQGGVISRISQQGRLAAASDNGGTNLENEIVHSIEYKNGFNLSAKIVQTSDQILGTLINIKA